MRADLPTPHIAIQQKTLWPLYIRPDPATVAGGIKVALLTTAAGLVIAVPVNIAYNFFVTRIDQLVADMEHGASKIMSLAWDLERDGKIEIVKKKDTRALAAAAAAPVAE